MQQMTVYKVASWADVGQFHVQHCTIGFMLHPATYCRSQALNVSLQGRFMTMELTAGEYWSVSCAQDWIAHCTGLGNTPAPAPAGILCLSSQGLAWVELSPSYSHAHNCTWSKTHSLMWILWYINCLLSCQPCSHYWPEIFCLEDTISLFWLVCIHWFWSIPTQGNIRMSTLFIFV